GTLVGRAHLALREELLVVVEDAALRLDRRRRRARVRIAGVAVHHHAAVGEARVRGAEVAGRRVAAGEAADERLVRRRGAVAGVREAGARVGHRAAGRVALVRRPLLARRRLIAVGGEAAGREAVRDVGQRAREDRRAARVPDLEREPARLEAEARLAVRTA